MSKELTAFFKGRVGVCESLYQYDFGIVMVLDSVMFDTVFDAYFSTTGEEDAIPVIGKYNRIAIPDQCLQKPGIVTLHIPVHDGQNDSEVEYIVTFKVINRARPVYDGTPEQSTAIAKALAVMQDIQGDVSTWLDTHPEATTTVLDGSITEAKLANTLKLKAIKDYVTPEMFGAVGNGVADDTAAVQAAFNDGKPVYLGNKYFITSTLYTGNDLHVFGSSTRNVNNYNLLFDTSVKACIVTNNNSGANSYVLFDSVAFSGTNLANQGLFISIGAKPTVLTLINSLVDKFDAAFCGLFEMSRISNCTFYRIAKALFLGKPTTNSFSYQSHTDLFAAINGQISGSFEGSIWESSITDCYISGQGVFYENVGLFVGGYTIDVKISNCYIDYWSAIYIDHDTSQLHKEPMVFNNCTLDSIITVINTTQKIYNYSIEGLYILNSLINRFNASFNSNVQVTIYDFIRYHADIYNRIRNTKIINCRYCNNTNNASLASYKFINLPSYAMIAADFTVDIDPIIGIDLDDIITLTYYSTDDRCKFPFLNYKVYDAMPKTALDNACDSFNGHIFVYSDDVYMNVNGTAYQISN